MQAQSGLWIFEKLVHQGSSLQTSSPEKYQPAMPGEIHQPTGLAGMRPNLPGIAQDPE